MTIQEFNNTRFGRGDKVIYQGEEYFLARCDFEEKLFGLLRIMPNPNIEPEETSWIRCENGEFIEAPANND